MYIQYAGLNGQAQNPIISHVFTADPSAHAYGGRIYVYASHDLDNQKGYDMRDYHVFSSDDLVNWQDHGVALDVAAISWASKLYAPDCAYGPATGKYYLYFPDSGSGIGVAVSDSPAGPFVDALGKPLIDKKTSGVSDVDWVFDPACFVDEDGQAYLYFGGGPQGTGDNARVVRLNPDMISLADAATPISAPDFFEASFMHKRNGKYYFSYATTFANGASKIHYMTSDNPVTGFVDAGTLLPNPAGNNYNNNHASVVEYAGSWYVFYHNRVLANRDGFSEYQRSITLDHLTYDAQGNLVEVAAQRGTVLQLKKVDALARMEAETMADQRGIEVNFVEQGGKRMGVAVTDLHNGDWIGYSQLDFGAAGATSFHARVASGAAAGGSIDVYLDGCDLFTNLAGQHIGTCPVVATGGWQAWTDVQCAVPATTGTHDLYLRFNGDSSEPLFNLDYFVFQ